MKFFNLFKFLNILTETIPELMLRTFLKKLNNKNAYF